MSGYHIEAIDRKKNLLQDESLTVKGDEMVGQWPCKFPRIAWYFLTRSGEISVEVIGGRRCGGIKVSCQLEFNLMVSCISYTRVFWPKT